MGSEKKGRRVKTSLYEVIREHLGLRKFEMAQLLGYERQWYTRKQNPKCLMTAEEILQLYAVSGMTPEQFVMALMRATAGAG